MDARRSAIGPPPAPSLRARAFPTQPASVMPSGRCLRRFYRRRPAQAARGAGHCAQSLTAYCPCCGQDARGGICRWTSCRGARSIAGSCAFRRQACSNASPMPSRWSTVSVSDARLARPAVSSMRKPPARVAWGWPASAVTIRPGGSSGANATR